MFLIKTYRHLFTIPVRGVSKITSDCLLCEIKIAPTGNSPVCHVWCLFVLATGNKAPLIGPPVIAPYNRISLRPVWA